MAGGNFSTQNKVRPGIYINFKTKAKPLGTLGDRGIVTMPIPMSWGDEKVIIKVDSETDFLATFGYEITHPNLLLIREALKRAKEILVYRVNDGGVKSYKTIGGITVTAKYTGVRGNDVSVAVIANVDIPGSFDVVTYLSGSEVDKQTVTTIDELVGNNFVTFGGTGTISEAAATALTSGTDGVATAGDYTDYLGAVEVHKWNTMAVPTNDGSIKSVVAAFIKRLRDTEGMKVQAVIPNYSVADYEGIISVKNGVILSDKTVVDSVKATAWVAAATAGANINESLTYDKYDDAIDVDVRYTNSQIEAALSDGEFMFTISDGAPVVEQDVNTFKNFTTEKGKAFRKNRQIRTMDSIANDSKLIYERYYLGKVDNTAEGRNLLKSEMINYMNTLQNIGAIQNFDPVNDIEILPGEETDAVVQNIAAQGVDSAEKIYMTVTMK